MRKERQTQLRRLTDVCLSVSLATSKLTNCLVVSGEQQGKGLADGLCLLRASAFVSGQLSAVLASSHGTWQLSWIICARPRYVS